MTVYSLTPGWSALTPGNANDGTALTLGSTFSVTRLGACTGIEFQAPNPAGASDYTVELWRLTGTTTGVLLASKTVPIGDITPGDWNFAEFDAPVALSLSEVYVAAFHSPLGLFRITDNVFTSTMDGTDGVVIGAQSGSEVAGITVNNGVFRVGGPDECPDTGSPDEAFYWVQPFFDDTIIPPSGDGTGAMLAFFGGDR